MSPVLLPYIREKDPFRGALYVLAAAIGLALTSLIVWHIVWERGTNLYELTSKWFRPEDFRGLAAIPYTVTFPVAFAKLWIINSWAARFRPVTRWRWLDLTFKWVLDWFPSVAFFALMCLAVVKYAVFDGRAAWVSAESWMLAALLIFSIYDAFGHQKENTAEARRRIAGLISEKINVEANPNDPPDRVLNQGVRAVVHDRGTTLVQGGRETHIPPGQPIPIVTRFDSRVEFGEQK